MGIPPSDQASPLHTGCPMASHNQEQQAESVVAPVAPATPLHKGCPMASHNKKSADEPGDEPDHFVPAIDPTQPKIMEIGDEQPGTPIPSSGRGNSDDGTHWVNPSANQLFRALKRKNKPIHSGDARNVADVHAVVTDMSWDCVMEYENLHPECKEPTLARFFGMYGILSWKSKLLKFRTGIEPFDRHDWVVDRCGKEVRYIIDYYSVEVPNPNDPTGDPEIVYSIDARPALTLAGIVDRAHLAFSKWSKGEDIW